MSNFIIREDLLPSFYRNISPVCRKCQKHNIPFTYNEVSQQYIKTNNIFIKYVEIEVDIKIKYNNWNVVAQIQRTASGNNLISGKKEFDNEYNKYVDNDLYCEHCNTHRRRNVVYILKHAISNEIKVVGSSCLKEFTDGLDASITAQCFEVLSSIMDLENLSNQTRLNNQTDKLPSNSYYNYSLDYIISLALTVCEKENGYKNSEDERSTSHLVKDFLNNKYTLSNDDILRNNTTAIEYINWVKLYINSKEDLSYFDRNLKTLCNSEKVCWNEIGLACSIVFVYQKNNSSDNNMINEYYGEINQRVNIEIKNIKSHSLDSFYGSYFIHVITSTEGYTFVWKTGKIINEYKEVVLKSGERKVIKYVPKTITGIIASHDTFRDVKQTVLKRCKGTSFTAKDYNTNESIDEDSLVCEY